MMSEKESVIPPAGGTGEDRAPAGQPTASTGKMNIDTRYPRSIEGILRIITLVMA